MDGLVIVAQRKRTSGGFIQHHRNFAMQLKGRRGTGCTKRAFDHCGNSLGLVGTLGKQDHLIGPQDRADTHRDGEARHVLGPIEKPGIRLAG